MIDRASWSKLGGLVFVARRLVEGLWAGRHASTRIGSGLEFHDYRGYSAGDDVAEIDWKLFGRTDRYFVRRHRQLTDLQAYLMVDCSASLNFAGLDRRGRPIIGPGATTKLTYAASLAAAIAYLTIRQSDLAGLGVFADRLLSHLPPGGTWSHLQRLCTTLEQTGPAVGTGDTPLCLQQAHALMKRRGLVVLIGDLLEEPADLMRGLSRFRHDHFEVIVFQVLTPQELDLGGLGRLQLQLVDAETRRTAPADIAKVRRGYAQQMDQHLAALRRGCLAQGVDYNLITTDQPVAAALRRYLALRNARPK
jgi:uncharacterized protein (DUF58 family)